MLKVARWLAPFGMLAALFYALHDIVGSTMWQEYSALSDPISLLTADGAPNLAVVRMLSTAFGISQLLFSVGLAMATYKLFNRISFTGTLLFFVMSLISLFGFALYPMEAAPVISTQDAAHSLVNIVVLVVVVAAIYLISTGYLPFQRLRWLGVLSLSCSLVSCLFGAIHFFVTSTNWPYAGFTERLFHYSYFAYIFFVSFYYTFICPPAKMQQLLLQTNGQTK